MSSLAIITDTIYKAKDSFVSLLTDRSINFEREAAFAIQAISKNDFTLGVAEKNRQSVINAVQNIAAIGISLNPAKRQAYLVPRKNEICLDISYMGLLDLAIDSGSIKWGQCKIVRENDAFEMNALDQLPTHHHKPFDSATIRGQIVGVYVVVKTADGDYLTHPMNIGQVYEIRARSESFKKNSGPWVTDTEEMIKKTCVKQAYKMWPKTDRLDQAIHYLNTDGGEGINFDGNQKQDDIDIAPLIAAAMKTKTDAEALKFWKDNNSQLAKNPKAHAKLKEVIAGHRQKLKEEADKTVDVQARETVVPEKSDAAPDAEFVAAMDAHDGVAQ
jgi:recombination protein RecT